MFDQVLQMVKDHMNGTPQVAGTLPAENTDAIHEEIANHITNGLKTQAGTSGGGGLLSSLENGVSSGSPIVNMIGGGLVSSLASKFGLSPMITGAISAELPSLLQKFAHKTNDPSDNSLTPESVGRELSGGNSGGIGSMLGNL